MNPAPAVAVALVPVAQAVAEAPQPAVLALEEPVVVNATHQRQQLPAQVLASGVAASALPAMYSHTSAVLAQAGFPAYMLIPSDAAVAATIHQELMKNEILRLRAALAASEEEKTALYDGYQELSQIFRGCALAQRTKVCASPCAQQAVARHLSHSPVRLAPRQQKAAHSLVKLLKSDADELARTLKKRVRAVIHYTLRQRMARVAACVSLRFVSPSAAAVLFAELLPLSEWEVSAPGVRKLELPSTHPALKRLLGAQWNRTLNTRYCMAGYVEPSVPLRIFYTRKTARLHMDFRLRQCHWCSLPADL